MSQVYARLWTHVQESLRSGCASADPCIAAGFHVLHSAMCRAPSQTPGMCVCLAGIQRRLVCRQLGRPTVLSEYRGAAICTWFGGEAVVAS